MPRFLALDLEVRVRVLTLGMALGALALSCQRDAPLARLPPAEPAAELPLGKSGAAAAKPRLDSEQGGGEGARLEGRGSAAEPQRVLLSGTTEAYRRSKLAPRVAGVVARVLVREGMVVKEGDALVELDAGDFRLQLRQAEAARQVARAQLDATRVDWDRLSSLTRQNATPRSRFDQVNAQLQVAKAALAQAEVAVEMARKALRDATVRAPFSGIVTDVKIDLGEYATVTPPAELLTLEQVETLELRVLVPETLMPQVREGTPLEVRFGAIDRALTSRVTRLVPSLDPGSRSFAALVELDNRERGLRPGMFAEVRLAGDARAPAPERGR